ncbi:MAG: hypothetical protein LH647_15640 [Leptolyngbyaceae cyanobacterium CAN_BIN12]|nr:hypothetical protein [Leptolyngbyaceae cyanobacterium CAN_BIN12]
MKTVTSPTINPPKASRENFTIRMEPSLKQALKIRAIQENRVSSDLIEDALKLYFNQLAT